MKITPRQLRQIIKEELSRLNESIGVDTMETLESVLSTAYEEGRRSYRPDQQSWDGDPVHQDPHIEVVNQLLGLVREYLDSIPDNAVDSDNDGALDAGELRDIADDLEG